MALGARSACRREEQMSEKKTPRWVWIVLVVAGLPVALCSGVMMLGAAGAAGTATVQRTADHMMQDSMNKVAADSVAQYEMAKKTGDKIAICSQAGMVCAAYLQAKDEPSYLAWKKTEKTDCAAAGMPQ